MKRSLKVTNANKTLAKNTSRRGSRGATACARAPPSLQPLTPVCKRQSDHKTILKTLSRTEILGSKKCCRRDSSLIFPLCLLWRIFHQRNRTQSSSWTLNFSVSSDNPNVFRPHRASFQLFLGTKLAIKRDNFDIRRVDCCLWGSYHVMAKCPSIRRTVSARIFEINKKKHKLADLCRGVSTAMRTYPLIKALVLYKLTCAYCSEYDK